MVSKSSGSAIAIVSTLSWSRHREGAALAQEAVRKSFDLRRHGRRAIHCDQRYAGLVAERREHVALRDQAHIDQDFAQLIAALLLQLERALQVFRIDLAALDQNLAQAHEPHAAGGILDSVRVAGGGWRPLSFFRFHDALGRVGAAGVHHDLPRHRRRFFPRAVPQPHRQLPTAASPEAGHPPWPSCAAFPSSIPSAWAAAPAGAGTRGPARISGSLCERE